MEKMDVSIVIPAYNEENRIIPTLEGIYGYFASGGMEFEIIVVDDGSRDRTVQVVKQWQKAKALPSPLRGEGQGERVRIISHSTNMGKGAAVRTGVLDSKGALILFTDADLSTPIEEFEKLKRAVTESCDMAIGSRGLPDSRIVVPQPWYRRYIGKIFPYLVRLIVMRNFRDTQCGFKLFRKEAGKILFGELKTEGFAFDVEILYRAVKKNYRVKEIPVTWLNSSQSKVGLFREPFRMLHSILKIRVLCSGENGIRNKEGDGEYKSVFMPENHMDRLYNSPNLLVRFIHNYRLKLIVKLLSDGKNLKILDAGCGEGHLIGKIGEHNPENVFFGVDITDIALEKAILRYPACNFMKGDIKNLKSFHDGFFDVVICTEVLEHIYEYPKAIHELKRVLKEKGRFIVTFPNERLWTIGRFLLGRKPIKVPDHVNSFTPEVIIKEIDLKCVFKKNLPFNLSFFVSLCGLMEFEK